MTHFNLIFSLEIVFVTCRVSVPVYDAVAIFESYKSAYRFDRTKFSAFHCPMPLRIGANPIRSLRIGNSTAAFLSPSKFILCGVRNKRIVN